MFTLSEPSSDDSLKHDRRKIACPVCGFRFGADELFEGILVLGRIKAPRWPRRRRSGTYCPECGRLVVIATDVSPGFTEVSFL